MAISAQNRLRDIPVRVVGTPAVAGLPADSFFHRRRRAVQALSLLLIVLVPMTGLFRVDPIAGGLVILDRQVWFSDFFLFFGLWIFLATVMVFLYSIAGTVFCGWSCPQNTVAEWANFLTHKFLGKRAEVSLDGAPVRVTASKNRWLNWAALGLCFLGASMAIALVPMLYFYPASAILSFVTLRPDPALAGSLYWIYTVFVLIVLLDVTVLRHFWCRFICVYRVWQHSFKTRQTLHVAYDADRSADCEGCNYCVSQCFIDLDPRSTDVFDSCINCGECVDACHRMHRKQGTPGLLRFEFGERNADARRTADKRNNEYSLLGRARWALPFSALGLAMFAWGIWSYEPYHLSVDHKAGAPGQNVTDYQIAVANKQYRDAALQIRVSGIDPQSFHLSTEALTLGKVEHQSLTLSISPQLPRGLYRVQIEVRSADGWVGRTAIQHLAGLQAG
jgi:polyferredoxin